MVVEKKQQGPRKWQDIVPARPVVVAKKRRPVQRFFISLRRRIGRLSATAGVFTRQRLNKRRLVILIGAIVLVGGGVTTLVLMKPSDQSPIMVDTGNGYTVGQLDRGTPEYSTLLPSGKSIEQLGGWTKVSPAKSDPVFAYVDTLSGITIRVSQQKIPESFKDDAKDQVKTLAEEFTSAQVIDIGGTTVYIDQPAKGPQSVIFTKNNLLVSIRSSTVIDTGFWANYVGSLR